MTVVRLVTPNPGEPLTPASAESRRVAYKPDHDQSPEATPELLVPKGSADPETAGLSVTVVAGRTTTADLVLNAE